MYCVSQKWFYRLNPNFSFYTWALYYAGCSQVLSLLLSPDRTISVETNQRVIPLIQGYNGPWNRNLTITIIPIQFTTLPKESLPPFLGWGEVADVRQYVASNIDLYMWSVTGSGESKNRFILFQCLYVCRIATPLFYSLHPLDSIYFFIH